MSRSRYSSAGLGKPAGTSDKKSGQPSCEWVGCVSSEVDIYPKYRHPYNCMQCLFFVSVNTQGQSSVVAGGIYEHYKGKRYKVHGLVRHSESLEMLVLYEALYESELGKLWVRPEKMFLETIEVEGKKVPRFKVLLGT